MHTYYTTAKMEAVGSTCFKEKGSIKKYRRLSYDYLKKGSRGVEVVVIYNAKKRDNSISCISSSTIQQCFVHELKE